MDESAPLLLLNVEAIRAGGSAEGAAPSLDLDLVGCILAAPLLDFLALAGEPSPALPWNGQALLDSATRAAESLSRQAGVWSSPWSGKEPRMARIANRWVAYVPTESPTLVGDAPGHEALAAQLHPLTSRLPSFRCIQLHGEFVDGADFADLERLVRADPGLDSLMERADLAQLVPGAHLPSSGVRPGL